ncbi:MAG: EAL domain-containing protein [Steroidobacteraceae bacterium]|jgi:diguanylate cyclase (GGDEF)-like protein|nr:EAL domain-containing protein [Steroidobacteraceae bacterium]
MTSAAPAASASCVLVVDDDDTVRLLIAGVLEDAGYQVVTARDGAEALALWSSRHVDCIVTDVNMPRLNGFELCSRVRALPGGDRVQVLFLTGLDDYESIRRAYEAGGNDFSLKQINPMLLLERVRFLLRAKQMQDDLRTSEQRLSYAQRLAMLGHWERHADGRTIAISPVVRELLEVGADEDVHWETLCALVHPHDLGGVRVAMQEAIASHAAFQFEHRLTGRRGAHRLLRHQGEVAAVEGGRPVIRGTVQDVTDVRAQEDRIRFLAFHDPLTALPNRESAARQIGQSIQRAHGSGMHVAVLALSLDDFDRVASTMGRTVADAVLKTLGGRMRAQLRALDGLVHGATRDDDAGCVVARADGDTFLCVVGHLPRGDAALPIAERLQRAIASPLAMGDTELTLSASVGISLFPGDGATAAELIDNAFAALVHARGQKGACQFFASEISDRARERLVLESELRTALQERQFELHFQPRMSLAENRLSGAEALVRWRHPGRGLLLPGTFVPLMEETGLIVPLGSLVIEMVAGQAARWQRRFGPDFRISFNISPMQFAAVDLVGAIDAAVARAGARHAALEAEITESAMLAEPERVVAALAAFRERGMRLALDDFGTGYSSLSYLRRLPLDVLKIDRSFVAEIGVGRHGNSLINAIVSMAGALGLTCVAEGLETDAQLTFLGASGCQEVQGYLLARPMPAADFERWVPPRWQAAASVEAQPLRA